jgi:hypothetical protein
MPSHVVEGGPAAAAAAPIKKPGGAAPADPGRADPGRADAGSAAEVQGLQSRLKSAAGDGSAGVTPAMAADIEATLLQAQGAVSPDMKKLLDAAARDGGSLTPDTMKLLQGAGRAAKDQGLGLGIDPAVEKALLESDFDADKPAFEAAKPPAAF